MNSLNAEEQAILESVENEEWVSVSNLEKEIQRYQGYFQNHLGKIKEMTLKIPDQDWEALKKLAEATETSVPMLVATLVHQFLNSDRD